MQTTAERLGGRFAQSIDWERVAEGPKTLPAERVVPGVDVEQLQRELAPERAHLPQPHHATFRVPLDMTPRQFEDLRDRSVAIFLKAKEAQGWEVVADAAHRVQVAPGIYPARDLYDNVPLLDQREYQIRAWFRKKNPQPLRIELNPDWVTPTTIRR